MRMDSKAGYLRKPKKIAKYLGLFYIVIFATALSPFVLTDQRNVLVIGLLFLSAPVAILYRVPLAGELLFPFLCVIYLVIITIIFDGYTYYSTVGYTLLFIISYVVYSGSLKTSGFSKERMRSALGRIIQAYALLSLVQMLASKVGLPIPNQILSKGLWSYNSLAVEPSHAARILALTTIAYFQLSTVDPKILNIKQLFYFERKVIYPFVISILLTGSSLGVGAMFLTFFLLRPLASKIVMLLFLSAMFPILLAIDLDPVKRLLLFVSALPTLDKQLLIEADQSGAVRLMPLLIYLDEAKINDLLFWIGGGYGSIAQYVMGKMPGIEKDVAMAGFVPGYMMVTGIIGTGLFLQTFLLRFFNRRVMPLVFIFVPLSAFSAWNTQTFWYGLFLVKLVYHYSNKNKARGSV